MYYEHYVMYVHKRGGTIKTQLFSLRSAKLDCYDTIISQ